MTTTTFDADYLGRVLITPDSDARDYMGRRTTSNTDFMGRGLLETDEAPDILHVWSDETPPASTGNEPIAIELGTVFTIDAPIIVYGARIWAPGDSFTGRLLRVWETRDPADTSVVLVSQALPDDIGSGEWVDCLLDEPFPLDELDVISYAVSSNFHAYSYTAHACDADPCAVESPVTYNGDAGVFANVSSHYPATSFNSSFYFVDLLFTAAGS